jgi:hypothetical protein
LYIIDTIGGLTRVFIAIAPLCSYISGLLASFPMRAINKRLGRKVTMLLGLTFVLFSAILFWFIVQLQTTTRIEVALIFACVLLGIGTSTTNICSFSLTSDLIGLNTECGAFVYGIMSFADKLANGIIIALIQQFNPCPDNSRTAHPCNVNSCTVKPPTVISPECKLYYRQILTFVPVAVSIATVLMTISIWRTRFGANRHVTVGPERTPLLPRQTPSHNNENNERTSLIA